MCGNFHDEKDNNIEPLLKKLRIYALNTALGTDKALTLSQNILGKIEGELAEIETIAHIIKHEERRESEKDRLDILIEDITRATSIISEMKRIYGLGQKN